MNMFRRIKLVSFALLISTLLIAFNCTYADEHVHQYENHVCTYCSKQESGLYYEGEYKFSWQELIDRGYIFEEDQGGKRVLLSCSKSLVGDLVVDEGINVIQGSLWGDAGFTDSMLSTIILPPTVYKIGYGVFKNAAASQIILNEGLEIIGDDVFSGAKNLTSIVMPSTLKEMGGYTFSNCVSLESVTFLGDGLLDSFGEATFNRCSNLKHVDIHRFNGITGNMFYLCTSLESIDLSDNITYIWIKAFSGCSNLKSVKMTDSVVSLGDHCFEGCSSLTEIRMSGSIEKYPNHSYLFTKCDKLETVYIGKGTMHLTSHLFDGCNIKNLYIPLSVTNIECLFDDCNPYGPPTPEINVFFEGDEFDWTIINKEECFSNATMNYNVEY